MRAALDTNILAYAEGLNGAEKQSAVLDLISRLRQDSTVLPAQVLGELFNVLVKKAKRSRADARSALLSWRDTFAVVETSSEVMLTATDLAVDHQLGLWDAVILSTASQADCRLLLSEDMQAGFTWGGVTVVNPLMSPRHVLLDALLEDEP